MAKARTKRTTSGRKGGGSSARRKTAKRDPFLGDELAIIITVAVSIFLFLSNMGLCGPVGETLRGLQLGLLGNFGYAFPITLCIVIAFLLINIDNPSSCFKMTAFLFILILLSSVVQLTAGGGVQGWTISDLYEGTLKNGVGGGVLGGALAMLLYGIVGQAGALLLLFSMILICLVYITEKPLMRMLATSSIHAADRAREIAQEDLAILSENARFFREERQRLKEERRAYRHRSRGVDYAASRLLPEAGEEIWNEDGASSQDSFPGYPGGDPDNAVPDYAFQNPVPDGGTLPAFPYNTETDVRNREASAQVQGGNEAQSASGEEVDDSSFSSFDLMPQALSPVCVAQAAQTKDERQSLSSFTSQKGKGRKKKGKRRPEGEDIPISQGSDETDSSSVFSGRILGEGSTLEPGMEWDGNGLSGIPDLSYSLEDEDGPVLPFYKPDPSRSGISSANGVPRSNPDDRNIGDSIQGNPSFGKGKEAELDFVRINRNAPTRSRRGEYQNDRTEWPSPALTEDAAFPVGVSAYQESERPKPALTGGIRPAGTSISQEPERPGPALTGEASAGDYSACSVEPAQDVSDWTDGDSLMAPYAPETQGNEWPDKYNSRPDGMQQGMRGNEAFGNDEEDSGTEDSGQGIGLMSEGLASTESFETAQGAGMPFTGSADAWEEAPPSSAGGSPFQSSERPDPALINENEEEEDDFEAPDPREVLLKAVDSSNGTRTVTTASGKIITRDVEDLWKRAERKQPLERGEDVSSGAEAAEMPSPEAMEAAKPKKPYVFPPLSLLQRGGQQEENNREEIEQNAVILQQTLKSFGIGVTVTEVSVGPSVTRYELKPEQGVKVSKIVSLTNDIKMRLAAADIRIEAPIPGKSAVGIEVPNKNPQTVFLGDIFSSREFQEAKARIAFGVGKDISGKTIVTDIAKMPHLLIAGATGSGKSVSINTLIMSILYKYKPEDVRMIMVDPKVVELQIYNGIPHLLIPVVTEPKKAAGALNWAVAEMTDRYNKFAETGCRDLRGYNEKVEAVRKDPNVPEDQKREKLPQIVIIIDELADLMMVSASEVEDAICRIAQLARACGMHLVIATQRPSVNVITGLIKANVPSRIAFAVSSGVDSRTIIDMNGAEKLLGKGDMLFFPQGIPKPVRVQGAFVSDEEVQAVVDFLKENSEQNYNESITASLNGQAQGGASGKKGNDNDALFREAAEFIITSEKASIGNMQRKFRIGFNRAARIMDQLQEAGVVGPEEGTKPRKILISLDEFNEIFP